MTVENNGVTDCMVPADTGSSFNYDGVRYNLEEIVFRRPSETAVP